MFESLLANLLDKYASQYLEGIDSKSANLSIWKGDVSLRNLKVKTNAFDELKLPVTVRYGYLEELTLKIPWKDLKTKPVNVILKGLYVVLAPVAQDCLMSSSPDELAEALRKKARSAVDNLIKSEVAQKIPGFTERLLARILDNIQIQFERIHISYVDTTVASGRLSFGITVQGFTAKSADASGREAFVHESRILRKRVDLRCLSVYCNPGYDILQRINFNQPSIGSKAAQDAANSYLQQLIATTAEDASPLAKHMLLPLSTVTIIEINKSDEPDAKIPKYSVALNVPKIELRLSNSQLNGLSEVAALLAQRSRIQFYRSYRQPFRPIVKELDWFSKERVAPPTAAQRWRFACDAIVAELHELNRLNRFSAARFMNIMRNISRYKQLCCIPTKLLKPIEIEEMQRIDVLIPIDFLRIVRSKTVPDLIARYAAASDQLSTASNSQGDKKKKGWLRGWFSKDPKESPKGQDAAGGGGEASFGLGLSASEEQQLLDTIDTTDAELGAQGTPVHNAAEWIKMKLSLSVGELSIMLLESRSGNTGNTLGQFTLSSVNAAYRVRPAGWGLDADMRDLTLSDLTTYDVGKTSFPYIIKRAPSVKDDDVLLSLHVECNPPDGSCAMSVSARAQPLTIVYHKEYITALQAIFAVVPPSSLLVPVSDRLRVAPKSSSAANMRVARSIVASATILDVDLAAPIILVPQNGFLISPCSSALLVVSLGRFQLSTFPVSSLKREELTNDMNAVENMCSAAELTCESLAGNPECLTCEAIPPSVACVYDRMVLKVTGLKSLMCSVADKWWDAAAIAAGGWEFVLPINIDIAVMKLVCTSSLAAPLRVAIAIQNIQLNISRNNYMALFKIIDVFKASNDPGSTHSNGQHTDIEAAASTADLSTEVGRVSVSANASSLEESNSSGQEKVATMSITVSSKKLAIAMFCSDGSFNFSNCVPALALTNISIEGLYASYRSMPSGSSSVAATIGSFFIYDVRTSRPIAPCFRQLLRLVCLQGDRPAFSVIYDTNALNKVTTTNVSLHNLEILLISEPLALVAAIFVASKAEPTPANRSNSHTSGSATANAGHVKQASTPASSWTSEMNIFVINPNIALISNPADPASPRLNLNLSLMYHADSSDGSSSTRMCVQELNILRSVQGKDKADWDRLLEPASVTIEIAAAPVLKNMTILVKALAFKVSYADVRMLYSTYLTASKTFSDAMSVSDPPIPADHLNAIAPEDTAYTALPQLNAYDTDSGSEGYADAIQEFSHESTEDGGGLPARRGAAVAQQVFRVSVQLDKFHLSLLNTLGLWSNPILEVLLMDTMVDYLVGTDSHSSMGLSSCIMLTQWNPIAKTLEPLLESWTFRLEASQSFALMLIQSRDILNLNLSASQLKGTISTLKRIQADWADLMTAHAAELHQPSEHAPAPARESSTNQLAKASSKQLRTSPHTIINATGARLHLWLGLPYRGETLSSSHFIIQPDSERCIDSASLCPIYDCFVAPEIDDHPLFPYPCPLTKAGVSTLMFGSGQEACPCAIAFTELDSGATVTTLSSGYVVRNNTTLELQIAAHDTDRFQPLLPGQCWYPSLLSWRQFFTAPPNSRSFFLKCGLKQKSSSAVTFTSIDDPALAPAEELTSQQLAARMVQLPCDARLVAQSENTFFSGAEHIQFVGELDCFVQVLTRVNSSERGIDEGQFVACNIEPAFSLRNLTPVPFYAKFDGSLSSISFQLLPGRLFQLCSLVCGKSSISAGLKFDAGDGLKGLPSRVEFDVLGSTAVHPVDTRISHSISSKLGGATTTRLVVERTDGSEHVIYAPYWIVNRTGIPISVCAHGKAHEAFIDTSSLPVENMYSALPCDLSDLLEKKSASLVMWGFSSAEDGKGGRLQLQVTGAKWCGQSFAADQLGEIGCLELALHSSSKSSVVSVAIYSHVSPGAFWRSRTITLLPRHAVYNGTDEDLEILCKTPENSTFVVDGVENRPYPSAVVPSKQWAILCGAPGQNADVRNIKIRPLRLGKSRFHYSAPFNAENLDGYRLRCRSADGAPHDTMNDVVCIDMANPKIFPPSFNFKVDIKGSYGLLAAVVGTQGWQVYRVSNKSPRHIMFHQQSVPRSLADLVLPASSCDFALDDTDQKGEIIEIVVLAGPNEKPLHVFKIKFFNFDKSALKEMRHGDLKVTPSIQDGIYSLVVEPFESRSADTVSRLRDIGSGLARSFRKSGVTPPKGTTKFLEQANMTQQPVSATCDSSSAAVNVAMFSAMDEEEPSPTNAAAACGGGEAAASAPQAEEVACDKRIDVKIAGIGISIIDDKPQEILYVSILGVKYTRYASMGLDMHEVYIRRFQIDADSLIVLGHSIIPPDQMVQLDPSGILQIANNPIEPSTLTDADAASVWFVRLIRRSDITAMDLISEISVSIPSLDLSLQENSAMNVLRVVMDVAGSFSAGSSDDEGTYTENQLRSWLPLETPYIDLEPLYAVSHNVQRIYVENLSINPVAVRISLHLDSKPLELKGVKGGLMALPLIIVNMLKGMAGNIDRAPISLNRLVFKNLLTSRDRLVGRLIKHYTVQAAKESYKIVGSFELLGNPVGLISNVTEGLQEFVYAPIRGAKNSPKAFAVGLVKGTGALVKGSIYGAFSSVVSLSAAVGKGVAMLSLDDKFEQERLASAARHQNDHLGAALAHGFTAVGRGVISGVTELFMAPVRGAQEDGFTGLLKGIGKGVLGVVFKPAAGLIELASSTASGVRNMSNLLSAASGCHRIRPPRPFSNGVMQAYSLQWAYGVALLSAATDIRSHLGEQLFDFCQLSDRLLFVTNQRIIQVKAGGSNAAPGRWGSVQFDLPLDSIIAVCTEGNKLTVELDASADGVAVGSCAKFFGKKQGSSMVRHFDLKSPERRHFSSVLMSAIMSIRAATASSGSAAMWRPLSMGPVIDASALRATIGRATQVKLAVIGPQPWVSDDERRTCTLCDRKFTPFFRKHHCRMCGRIICSKCSPSRAPLPDLGYQKLVRLCSPCFAGRNVQSPFDALEPSASVSSASQLRAAAVDSDGVDFPGAAARGIIAAGADSPTERESPDALATPQGTPPHIIADAQQRSRHAASGAGAAP